MNDTQILTLAISFLIPLGLFFLGNSRIANVKEALRAMIKLLESKLEAKIDLGFERVEHQLEAISKILAGHEARLPH